MSRAYVGRANSFGFLRLVFAFAVMVAHTAVLGFGHALNPRIDVPGMAVAGFFGISGFLITRSARRSTLPRYLWHRALRIWPGLWVCLLLTAFLVAPVFWHQSHGSLAGLWSRTDSPLRYVERNWWGGHRQAGIGDLFHDTVYGRIARRSVMNGSLWTLAYEAFCYLLVAALAVLGVLRRARWVLLLAAAGFFGVLCFNQFSALRLGHAPLFVSGTFGPLPGLGSLMSLWFLRYGFVFLLGAVAELYSDRLPVNDLLGVAALAAVFWCVLRGELFGPALVPYEYCILWLAVRLPRRLHRVGQRNDYSYGVYIYSFPVQQSLARLGVNGFGFVPYLLAVASCAFLLAFASWHVVEKQALKLRSWSPVPTRYAARAASAEAERVVAADPGEVPVTGSGAHLPGGSVQTRGHGQLTRESLARERF